MEKIETSMGMVLHRAHLQRGRCRGHTQPGAKVRWGQRAGERTDGRTGVSVTGSRDPPADPGRCSVSSGHAGPQSPVLRAAGHPDGLIPCWEHRVQVLLSHPPAM